MDNNVLNECLKKLDDTLHHNSQMELNNNKISVLLGYINSLEEENKKLKKLQERINKAIMELDDPFENEDGDASWYEIAETYKEQINEAISILKGEDNED